MSEDEVICNNCRKLTKKSHKYCMHCGNLLTPYSPFSSQETQENLRDPFETQSIPSDKIGKFRLRDLSPAYKVLAFFIIVALVDFVASFIFMFGYHLPLNTYFMLFVGFYILFMIIVGLIWAVAAGSDFTNAALKGCAALFGIILLLAIIIIPIYVIYALPGIVGSFSFSSPALEELGQKITDAISNALNNFIGSIFREISNNIKTSWENAFADVEVPGFEPFLFLGLFISLSIFIIYKYHLAIKKNRINK